MKKIAYRLVPDETTEKEIFVSGWFPLKDFRLSWMINNHLGFRLENLGQINIPTGEQADGLKNQQSMFSEEEHEPLLPKEYSVNPVYFYAYELFYTKVYLLVNRES